MLFWSTKWHLQSMSLNMGEIQQLSPNQLDLIGKVVKVLSYIEEITKSIFCDAASIIPIV